MKPFVNALRIAFPSFIANLLMYFLTVTIGVVSNESALRFWTAMLLWIIYCFVLPIVSLDLERDACEKLEIAPWQYCLFFFVGNIAADIAVYIWLHSADMDKLFPDMVGLWIIWYAMIGATALLSVILVIRGIIAIVRYFRNY